MEKKLSIKRLLKSYSLLRQTALQSRSLIRCIFRGYRSYPGIPGRIHYDDAGLYDSGPGHYRQTAESALINIEICLNSVKKSFLDIESCLDLPCGYGRILRYLQTRLPYAAVIDACDIENKAVEFCAREFSVFPILSEANILKVRFPHKYDLIWMGSLITHLPRETMTNTFKAMGELLNPGGVYVFTTHGPACLSRLNAYGIGSLDRAEVEKSLTNDGFYFAAYPGDKEYGITLTTKEFILQNIQTATDGRLKLITHRPEGWDNHQDVFGFLRS